MSLPLIIEDIEDRFKISGGTLTGPYIGLKGGYSGLEGNEAYAEITSRKVQNDGTNHRSLRVASGSSDKKDSVNLIDYVNGNGTSYRIYGEHNKPTYADIGAKAWEPTSFGLNPNYIGVRTSGRTADQYYEFWDSGAGWADIRAREFYAGDGVNKVYHAGNKPTPADIGAPTMTGSGASGTWGISISGNAATATNASKLNGVASSAFKQTWATSAGKEYTGWIKLIEWKMSTSGHFSPHPFFFEIYRNYNSPSPESYIISLACGWGTGELAQISGGYSDRIIEQFRISCDSSKMTYWLEMYINPNYSTYSNICYCSVFGYDSFNGTLLTDAKQTASVTTVTSIVTGKGIVLPTATDYTTQKARNVAANTSLSAPANGNIFLVYT